MKNLIVILMLLSAVLIPFKKAGAGGGGEIGIDICIYDHACKSDDEVVTFGAPQQFFFNASDGYPSCMRNNGSLGPDLDTPICQLMFEFAGLDNGQTIWDPAILSQQKKKDPNMTPISNPNQPFCDSWYTCSLDHNFPGFACHNEKQSNGNYKGIGMKCMDNGRFLDPRRNHDSSNWGNEVDRHIPSWFNTAFLKALEKNSPVPMVNQPCQLTTQNMEYIDTIRNLAKGQGSSNPWADANAIKGNMLNMTIYQDFELTWAYEHICYSGADEYLAGDTDLLNPVSNFATLGDGKTLCSKQYGAAENASDDGSGCKSSVGDGYSIECPPNHSGVCGCPSQDGDTCLIYKDIMLPDVTIADSIQEQDKDNQSSPTWPFHISYDTPPQDAPTSSSQQSGSTTSALISPTSPYNKLFLGQPRPGIHHAAGFSGALFIFNRSSGSTIGRHLFNTNSPILMTKGGIANFINNSLDGYNAPVITASGGVTNIAATKFMADATPIELGVASINITGSEFHTGKPVIKKAPQTNCGGMSFIGNKFSPMPDKLIEFGSTSCYDQVDRAFAGLSQIDTNVFQLAFTPKGYTVPVAAEIYNNDSGKSVGVFCSNDAPVKYLDYFAGRYHYLATTGKTHLCDDASRGSLDGYNINISGDVLNSLSSNITVIFYQKDKPLGMIGIGKAAIDTSNINRKPCLGKYIMQNAFFASFANIEDTDKSACVNSDLCCSSDTKCIGECVTMNECIYLKDNFLTTPPFSELYERICQGGTDAEVAETYRNAYNSIYNPMCYDQFLSQCITKKDPNPDWCASNLLNQAYADWDVTKHSKGTGFFEMMHASKCAIESAIGRIIPKTVIGPSTIKQPDVHQIPKDLSKGILNNGPFPEPGPGGPISNPLQNQQKNGY